MVLVQETEDQSKCAKNKVVRHQLTRHAFSRHHRYTFWISWNIICKFIVVGCCQNAKSTFCTVREASKFGVVYQRQATSATDEDFPRSTCDIRFFGYNVTQLCSRMTPAYHRATRNKTFVAEQAPLSQTSCHLNQDKRTKNEPKRRRHRDSPPPEQQGFVLLLCASFANQAAQTEHLSSTTICGQLRHRHLLLLEFFGK